jgi:hypothetical protein
MPVSQLVRQLCSPREAGVIEQTRTRRGRSRRGLRIGGAGGVAVSHPTGSSWSSWSRWVSIASATDRSVNGSA